MPHRTLITYIYQSPGPGEFGISRVRREATGLFHGGLLLYFTLQENSCSRQPKPRKV